MRNIFKISWLLLIECYLISWVKATGPKTLNTCSGKTSGVTNCDDASYYCTQTGGSNTTILKLKASGDDNYCEEIKNEGYYIFEISNADSDLKLLTSTDSITTAGDLAIYKCDGSTCTPQYGHFKHNDKYYTISASEVAKEIIGSGYYSIINDSTDFIKCTPSATQGQPSTCQSFTKTNGYFMNSDNEVYKCTSSSCTPESDIAEVNACTSNANKIINDTGLKYCGISSGTPIEFSATSQYVTYKNVKKSDTSYPSTIVSGNDILLLKMDQYSLTPVTSASGYILADEQDNKSTLYNCSTVQNVVTCTAEDATIKGYFKVTDTTFKGITEYIKCDGGGCIKQATPSEAAVCKDSGIASLILNNEKIKLCITADETNPSMVEFASGKYMISISEENIFGNNQDSFTLINVSGISIVTETANGYYIADETTNALISAKDKVGILYSCNDGVCTSFTTPFEDSSTYGYYKNNDNVSKSTIPYIRCYKDTIPDTPVDKCVSIESPTSTTICSKTTIGQLVNGGKLCLDGTKEVSFETTTGNSKVYFVNYSVNSIYTPIIDDEEKYGVVVVTTDSMTVDITDISSKKVCMNTSREVTIGDDECAATLKTYSNCGTGFCYRQCNVSTGSDCLSKRYYPFSDADGTTVQTDLSNLGFLFYCETDETECSKVSKVGYYKNINPLSSTSSYDYIKCTVDADAENAIKCIYLESGTSCNNKGDIINDSDIFKLCIATGDSPIKVDLSQTGQYFVDLSDGKTAFGTKNGYAIINFDGKDVLLSLPETNVELYRYGSKDTQKLIDFSSATDNSEYCGAGKSPLTTNTIEFSLIIPEEGDLTNYYKKEDYPED